MLLQGVKLLLWKQKEQGLKKKTGKKEEMALETRELIFKRLHNN